MIAWKEAVANADKTLIELRNSGVEEGLSYPSCMSIPSHTKLVLVLILILVPIYPP